jgi:VWFA-related protein
MRQLVFFLVGITCAVAPLVIAQQPPVAMKSDDPSRIVLDVNRVNILFTVTDKRGRFIDNLVKENFEVLEGKNRQKIIEFAAESDLPLRLAILIDTSNSVRDRFRFQQEAAIDFIHSVIRPPQDKALVASFDSSYTMKADLTGQISLLDDAVRAMRPGGGTALFDAIYYACKEKLSLDRPMHEYRRAMIILTDGEDTQSNFSRDQALEMAQKADVVIYAISTNITRIQSDGDKVLKYLTEQTGGVTFFPFKAEDLAQSFQNVANELRHQYSIIYRPEPMHNDGRFHPITVKVAGRTDMIVRARKEYFAEKQ